MEKMPEFTTPARVREFSNDNGWGILDAPGDVAPGGIWFWFSALDMDGYKTISAGANVEADVVGPGMNQDGYSYVAKRIRLVPDEPPEPLHRRRRST